LNLIPKGIGSMHTGSSGASAHRCNIYDISLIVPNPARSLIVNDLQIHEIELAASGQPFLALIGRDILDKCNLFYLGELKQAILVF
jgi:hypothetical protein